MGCMCKTTKWRLKPFWVRVLCLLHCLQHWLHGLATLVTNFVGVGPIFKISAAKCISSFWKDYWYYSCYPYYSYYRNKSPTSIRAINPSTPFVTWRRRRSSLTIKFLEFPPKNCNGYLHVMNGIRINDRIVDSQNFDSMLLRDLSFIIISRNTWRHLSLTLGNPDDLFSCLKATSSAGLVRIWKQWPLMQWLQCNTYFMKSWKVHFLVSRVVECNVNTKRFIIP